MIGKKCEKANISRQATNDGTTDDESVPSKEIGKTRRDSIQGILTEGEESVQLTSSLR